MNFSTSHTFKFRQYKNVNIANFVYYGKIRMIWADVLYFTVKRGSITANEELFVWTITTIQRILLAP